LGGYGLGGAAFNYEIKLEVGLSKQIRQNSCFLDLYYKKAKLAVEYESFAYHSKPAEQGKDAIRAAVLERQGIEVVRVNTIQAYDSDSFRILAFNLAARLGKRISIRTERFEEMHKSLRMLLPTLVKEDPGADPRK
jgi:3-hydroxy-3-methylglutaryl CoA synthase